MSTAQRESRFFRAWATWVVRWRWPVLLVTLLITGLFARQMNQHLYFDSSVEYFAAGSEARALLERFQEDFGNDTWHIVLIEGDVFSVPFLERLTELHDAIEGGHLDLVGGGTAAPAAGQTDAADEPDGFGSADDAVGFGSADDAVGFGSADDAVGFGSADDGGPSPAPAAGEDWGEGGGSIIEEVTSLINARQTVFEGGAVRVRGLFETLPAESELAAIKAKVLADPTLVNTVVGREGRHAVIMMRTNVADYDTRSAIYHALSDAVADYEAPGFAVSVTGMPALNAELVGTMQADMRRLIIGAFLVMSIVLGWLFRHPAAVIAPLVVVALAAIWTLGLMASTGTPVTLLTNIIPAFLACVGLGDSIHVQSVYRDAVARGKSPADANIYAVASTGMPILFTTLTTAVGLLSFRFATMEAISEMGAFAAFGVAMALLHSVTFLPIALSFVSGSGFAGGSGGDRQRDWIDGLLARATSLSSPLRRGPLPVIGVGVLLLAVALVGISRIAVYHNPVDWLPEDYTPRVDLDRMDHDVGGTAQVNLVIEAPGELGMHDLELLRGLESLEQYILAYRQPDTGEPLVTGTSSLLDVLRDTNRALHGGDPDHYALPDSQRGVSDALLLFESAAPRDLRRLATADLKKSHMTLRIHWMDATAYQPFTVYLADGIDQHIGELARVQPTGSVYELVTTVSGMIGDLLRSFGAALVSVTITMILLLRSFRLGLISMIPNLVPVALVMGFMGFTGIPLDLTNLLIASIVIGVAVDNTVHYVFQWKAAESTGAGLEGGILYALEHAGRALVGTGLILGLGFGVYLLASMVNIQRFGMLVGSACVFALFTNLVFAPALLRFTYGGRGKALSGGSSEDDVAATG